MSTEVLTEYDPQATVRSCRYCPMCRHADLVATLERRETYSARGRGLILFAIEKNRLTWDSQVADVMYRFFDDGLCRQVCAGHIPHDEMVINARRQLVAAGHAPGTVAQVKSNIERTGNPWGENEPDLFGVTRAEVQSHVLIYFGPAARIRRPAVVKALVTILKAAGVEFSILADESDPGLLLYELGEAEAAEGAAKALATKIAKSGARTVVTPDADAYRTLKAGFGQIAPLSGPTVWHTSEFIAGLVDRLKFRTPTHSRVAYHDPCALARFALCMDAPRALIRAVSAATPLEIGAWSRELANCSGECGGVPFTHPALSRKAAERRICEAREAGADLILAGSPAAAAALEGGGLQVRDLSEFVAESLI